MGEGNNNDFSTDSLLVETGLKLEKLEPTFSSFNVMPSKISKLWLLLHDKMFLISTSQTH